MDLPVDDAPRAAPDFSRRVIAVGGGKGGIGKSLLSANLGVHAATAGTRVVLVDADLGGANLHTCLGIPQPKCTLSDFVNRRVQDLSDVVTPTAIPGLGLVSGALDYLGAANPKYTQKLRLLREITRLDVDCIIIDLGGGTGFNILDFFLIADYGVLTVVPEPTSVENAYRFIKAAYYRRLKTIEQTLNLRPLMESALGERAGNLRTPADLIRTVEEQSPQAGAQLRAELEKLPLNLVVNQARTPEDLRLGTAISDACRRYFGIRIDYLGAIPYDDAVWRSVRHRRPLLSVYPDAPAARAVREIAQKLGFDA